MLVAEVVSDVTDDCRMPGPKNIPLMLKRRCAGGGASTGTESDESIDTVLIRVPKRGGFQRTAVSNFGTPEGSVIAVEDAGLGRTLFNSPVKQTAAEIGGCRL